MSVLEKLESKDFLICEACGQQYGTTDLAQLPSPNACFICDDERQFVPVSGQSWTTLSQMRAKPYKNIFTELPGYKGAWSIYTTPKFAIGQRAILLTDADEGNTLWDCITFLDEETVKRIQSMGGLKRICISHPHYYTTALDWAAVFTCPVMIFEADRSWITRPDTESERSLSQCYGFCKDEPVQVSKSLSFHKVGGHFDGSGVLHSSCSKGALFVGDTLSLTPGNRRVTIMWSYPNMIPLDAQTVAEICWPVLKPLRYEAIYSKFVGEDLLTGGQEVVRRSLQFYCRKLKGATRAFEV
jgi:hypothetical protein